MDGEEDDYMGDLGQFLDPALLQKSKKHSPAAVNPTQNRNNNNKNNNHNRRITGKQRWQEKRKVSRDRAKQAEDEKRDEALNSAIPSSNIGFKMLQQMGYKPGDALGKHGQGSVEPIKVEPKHSRTGLGVDEIERQSKVKRARQSELQQTLKRKMQDVSQRDFRDRQRSSWQAGKLYRDYKKAFGALLTLDESAANEIARKLKREDDGDEEQEGGDGKEEEEVVTEEILFEILTDLRNRFHYCVHCGCKYDSAEDMENSCPGLDEDDH